MLDDLHDQMPFSIEVEWESRKIELLIMPEWCPLRSEMRFIVYRLRSKLGVLIHDESSTDDWIWLEGDLDHERANLVGPNR